MSKEMEHLADLFNKRLGVDIKTLPTEIDGEPCASILVKDKSGMCEMTIHDRIPVATAVGIYRLISAGENVMSETRIKELLDYATGYGEYDETSPDSAMCSDYRRDTIRAFKELLRFRGSNDET